MYFFLFFWQGPRSFPEGRSCTATSGWRKGERLVKRSARAQISEDLTVTRPSVSLWFCRCREGFPQTAEDLRRVGGGERSGRAGTAERVIASDYDGHFLSPVFRLPREMAATTSDFWERRGPSEEGVVAVEVSAGRHVGDRRRSVLRVMKRNPVDVGASRLDDVLLMRMDSGSRPLKGTLRQGSRNGQGVEVRGAARRASERSVASGRIGR
ncbi:uncharacterized protein WM294_007536 [Sarcoramphus papa]